jgi:hypothetical protein
VCCHIGIDFLGVHLCMTLWLRAPSEPNCHLRVGVIWRGWGEWYIDTYKCMYVCMYVMCVYRCVPGLMHHFIHPLCIQERHKNVTIQCTTCMPYMSSLSHYIKCTHVHTFVHAGMYALFLYIHKLYTYFHFLSTENFEKKVIYLGFPVLTPYNAADTTSFEACVSKDSTIWNGWYAHVCTYLYVGECVHTYMYPSVCHVGCHVDVGLHACVHGCEYNIKRDIWFRLSYKIYFA